MTKGVLGFSAGRRPALPGSQTVSVFNCPGDPFVQYCVEINMGSLKKRRKAKINKHKRRKKLRAHRHKKRTWQK
jgi:hypothetical protein